MSFSFAQGCFIPDLEWNRRVMAFPLGATHGGLAVDRAGQFDDRRRYVKSFGGVDAGPGRLRNCHGLAWDSHGPQPLLLICDRRNRRLVHYDLEGRFAGVFAEELRRPCSVAFDGELLAIAELEGRVSILNRKRQSIMVLGNNPDQTQWAAYDLAQSQWRDEVFHVPHSVCFDAHGNLVVSEWKVTGRLTKLTKIKPSF